MQRARIGGLGVVVMALTTMAYAAPGSDGPSTGKPSVQKPAAMRPLEVTISGVVLPTTVRCGEPIAADVEVTNNTGKPSRGYVRIPPYTHGFTLPASGANKAVKRAQGRPFGCQEPLPVADVVLMSETGDVLLQKPLRPIRVDGVTSVSPPSNATTPWLRRVQFEGTCGGVVQPSIWVQNPTSQAVAIKAKISFGSTSSVIDATLQPNQPTALVLPTSTPLDCKAAIPVMSASIESGGSGSGSASLQNVTFGT